MRFCIYHETNIYSNMGTLMEFIDAPKKVKNEVLTT